MPMLPVNGESIYYERSGVGPAVVLIHSLGANAQMWKLQVEALADTYSTVTMDCRGHGRSSANGPATVDEAARDLKAVLDHLDVGACHAVGIGMGAAVALHLNANAPGLVRSLVLADFTAKPADGSADRIAATREAIAYISMQEFGTQYAAEHLMFETPLEVQEELAAAIAAMNPKTYIEMMQSACRDFTPLLAGVKMPALVIVGANDSEVSQPQAERMAQQIGAAAVGVIASAAHLSNLDNPAVFNAALLKFLSAQA